MKRNNTIVNDLIYYILSKIMNKFDDTWKYFLI